MKKTFIHRETGKALAMVRGNRARLALAFAVLLLSVLFPLVFALNLDGILYPVEELTEAEMALETGIFLGTWLLTCLLITPCVISLFYRYGYKRYLSSRDASGYGGEPVRLGMFRSWLFGFWILMRPAVCAIPIGVSLWGAEMNQLLRLPLLAVAVTLCVLWMRWTANWFLLPYRMCLGDSVLDAMRNSRRMIKGHKKLYGRYILSFLPHGLLSVLTVGVWLVFHTLPSLIFTYFTLAESLCGEGIQKETIS